MIEENRTKPFSGAFAVDVGDSESPASALVTGLGDQFLHADTATASPMISPPPHLWSIRNSLIASTEFREVLRRRTLRTSTRRTMHVTPCVGNHPTKRPV
jgi:hypothetical protein